MSKAVSTIASTMLTRLFHIFAVAMVVATCLLSGEQATLCVTESGAWRVHANNECGPAVEDGCGEIAILDESCAVGFDDDECCELEMKSVVKQAASRRDVDGLSLSLRFHASLISLATMPPMPPTGTIISGKSWSAIHAPPRLAIADLVGIRQI